MQQVQVQDVVRMNIPNDANKSCAVKMVGWAVSALEKAGVLRRRNTNADNASRLARTSIIRGRTCWLVVIDLPM